MDFIFISNLILLFILFLLSLIFYIKKKCKAHLFLCIGLFILFLFSNIWGSGNIASASSFTFCQGIFPLWLGKIIFSAGKLLILIGFILTIFKPNYKR